MMDSVIREAALDLIIPIRRQVAGLSKAEKKNLKRRTKQHYKLEQEFKERLLPVTEQKDRIIDAVKNNQVTVIVAETGCGKSSQVPQLLLREGVAGEGMIVCTQPRRVAAWSLATRVAKEMDCRLGEEVGYHVRYERVTSPATQIAYVTDGVLLQQCLHDERQVEKYSLVIIDEVHERSLQMDFLLGVMKRMLPRRKDLKLVIMSATMNTEKFSDFFDQAPVVEIVGKHFPVQMHYEPGHSTLHILSVIAKILDRNKPADMLVFLPGRADIEAVSAGLGVVRPRPGKNRGVAPCAPLTFSRHKMLVVEAHAELPDWELNNIFQQAPPNYWKIILATNVAESSLTVDGLRFVVDSGFVNVKVFDGTTGVDRLVTRLISKSEAEQRKGRVGRTQPGVCYRLYRESQVTGPAITGTESKDIDDELQRNFRDFPQPMIEREELSQFLLILRKYGFMQCEDFPFISPPNETNVKAAEADLFRLGALDGSGELTPSGKRIVAFPLYPRLAAALLEAARRGCAYGMLLLTSMLSAFNGGRLGSLSQLSGMVDASDEVETLINLLNQYKHIRPNDNVSRWFWDTFGIKADFFYEAVSTYRQLKALLERHHGEIATPDSASHLSVDALEAMYDVRGVLQSVFAPNFAIFCEGGGKRKKYVLVNGQKVAVKPRLAKNPTVFEEGVCGINLFAVKDARNPLSSKSIFLTCAFKADVRLPQRKSRSSQLRSPAKNLPFH